MNAFGVSLYLIYTIVITYPIMFFLKSDIDLLIKFSMVPFLIVPFFMIWFYKGFYSEKSLKTIILRVLFIVFLLLLVYILLIVAGIIYVLITGPESLQYLTPKK